jgi:hypothetical protein
LKSSTIPDLVVGWVVGQNVVFGVVLGVSLDVSGVGVENTEIFGVIFFGYGYEEKVKA